MANFRDLQRRICKKLLKFLNDLCFIFEIDKSLCVRVEVGQDLKTSQTDRPAERPFTRWPWVVLVLYLYAAIKLTFTISLEYAYDFEYVHLLRLGNERDPFLQLTPMDDVLARNSSAYLEQEARVKSAKKLAKSVGSPLINMHLANESAMEVLLAFSVITYLGCIVFTQLRLINPENFYFVRMMLDEPTELTCCRQDTRRIVANMNESSKNYMLHWADTVITVHSQVRRHDSAKISLAKNLINLGELPADSTLRHQQRLSYFLEREAIQLQQSDALMPINRCAEWIDKMSVKFVAIFSTTSTITIVYLSGVLIYAYSRGALTIASYKDALHLVEISFILVVDDLSAAFYIAVLFATYPNQLDYMKRLNERLRTVITFNDELFMESQPLPGYSLSKDCFRWLEKEANRRLMRALLEFEVFVDQFARTKESFAYVIIAGVTSLFAAHGFTRLHLPYMAPRIYKYVLAISINTIALFDLYCVPICQIYNESVKLYSVLTYLLAHTIELNERMDKLAGRPFYSTHLVWRLRNTLKDPENFIGRFSAGPFGGSFTMSWTGLFKIHYIYGLLILSAFFQVQSWRTLIGARVDDPLALYEVK